MDLEQARKVFVANDPRSLILPPEIYSKVVSQPPPIQEFVDSLKEARKTMTIKQRKAAYERAKTMRDYAEAACKALTE